MSHNNCYLHSVEVERFIILLVRLDEKCNLMNLMMVSWWLNTHTIYAMDNCTSIEHCTRTIHSILNAQNRNIVYGIDFGAKSISRFWFVCDVGEHWKCQILNIAKLYVFI